MPSNVEFPMLPDFLENTKYINKIKTQNFKFRKNEYKRLMVPVIARKNLLKRFLLEEIRKLTNRIFQLDLRKSLEH